RCGKRGGRGGEGAVMADQVGAGGRPLAANSARSRAGARARVFTASIFRAGIAEDTGLCGLSRSAIAPFRRPRPTHRKSPVRAIIEFKFDLSAAPRSPGTHWRV